PMTRTKINDDLSATNAPAVSAEITETGTTTPTHASTTTSTLPSGCSSTTGFSPTTGKPCLVATIPATTVTVNNTVTLATGAMVEIDALGNIVRTVTPAPESSSSSVPTVQQQISQIQTSLNQIVQNTAPAQYSPVSPPQVSKDITISVDKSTISLNGWESTNINAVYTENGKSVPVEVLLSSSEISKTYRVIKDWPYCSSGLFLTQEVGTEGGSCTTNGKIQLNYLPKTLGLKTFTVKAGGVTKTIDIAVTPYTYVPPIATITPGASSALYPNQFEQGQSGISVASILVTQDEGQENLHYSKIKLSVNPSSAQSILRPRVAGSTYSDSLTYMLPDSTEGTRPLSIIIDTPKNVGPYSINIDLIELTGQYSGLVRQVSNVPLKTQDFTLFDQNMVQWYAYNSNHTISGYSTANHNENGLKLINQSQTPVVIKSIDWEKQTTGNLQVQNISLYPTLPAELPSNPYTWLVNITYSGTPQAGDRISIKPIITLSSGQQLKCPYETNPASQNNSCWLTWSQ
ncbi:MAG: hypothetical protein WBC83_00315, partial [Minisyncoccia bacterium]